LVGKLIVPTKRKKQNKKRPNSLVKIALLGLKTFPAINATVSPPTDQHPY
jgi:hypothetical protein